MEGSSKFLPDSVSAALKSALRRAFGVIMVCVGVWATFSLMFHDSFLDGYGAAGSLGHQSFMGNIVGFLRYGVGFVPTLFLCLCAVVAGLSIMARQRDTNIAYEYNIMRAFIALCCGAAGFGMVAPSATFGGLVGVLATGDVYGVIGGWTPLVGILFLGVFFVIAGILLHIKLSYVMAVGTYVWRGVLWILSLFHLTRCEAGETFDVDARDEDLVSDDDDVDEEDDDVDEEYEDVDEEDDAEETPARKSAARRGASKRAGVIRWKLPDPKLLEKSVLGKSVITHELKQIAQALEVRFAEYGIRGNVVGISPGPIVTLFQFKAENGTRMANITKTTEDMTRAMAVEKIRISHITKTDLIGVEVANINPQTVRYQTLISDKLFVESKHNIPLALGVDIGGNPLYYNLAKMPHMLIAGRTGSGKSVFVQSIITSIVYHFTPDKCKLMIIDPKGVDFGFWDDIPHLITPIVKLDPNGAINALKWAVREMEDRYKRMQVLSARNVESYNEIAAAKRAAGEVITQQIPVGTDPETGALEFEEQEVDLSDIPYIVIIIDEVADLLQVAKKDVEACIQRIAQKARAAGIHLVMATQRPDAQTITGVIKANFPTRVSFQARSVVDSMTTLGEKGAEQLLPCGDMLFSEAGRPAVRIHGAFISDAELTKIGNFLRAQGEPEYAAGVTDDDAGATADMSGGASAGGGRGGGKDDDLYEQAKQIVIRDKKPTISYLQRRLSVGYNKAATLIERMEQDGIVSAPNANGKREILV